MNSTMSPFQQHIFCELYLAYKLEMNCIANTAPDKFDGYIKDIDYFCSNDCKYHVRHITDYGLQVGFIVWHEIDDGCYIDEAYIAPLFRGRGLMKKEVMKLRDKYKHISMYILDDNKNAKDIWEHLLGELEKVAENELGHEYETK